ncbi:MAG: SusD/RagB family nutrient-binding outer membrane lipoprotein [Prevotellaceae bacterium]|jgi:hypothetical protein|nr:SusD/RagB family nutrient-binding outer membrane lipoprotein [Prevotellaceae bacterium]
MKKIILISGLLGVLLLGTQCKDDQFNEYYTDPSKVGTIQIDRMMAGLFRNADIFWAPDYARYYALDGTWLGTFSQTLGGKGASAEMYNPSYSETGYWDRFYTALGNFRLMEQLYNNMQEAEQKANECFMIATRVFLYDYLSLIVSIYGDVPFTKAGYLPVNNDIPSSFAEYDSEESIYDLMLTDLAHINGRFADAEFVTAAGRSNFATQDILIRGSLVKWNMYANAIRLRIANRLASNSNPLQEKAKSVLKEILENPQTNPLPETNEQNIVIKNYRNNFMNYTAGGGLNENGGWRSEANQALIDRMRTDPRLRLLYLKTDTVSYRETDPDNRKYNPANGIYLGRDYKDATGARTQGETQFYREDGATGISRVVQHGFFWENKKFDAFMFSAPEIWFIKAEAEARGFANVPSETAESCFKKAVQLSLSFYFYYYENWESNGGGNPPDTYKNITVPDSASISDFSIARWAAIGTDYVNNIDAIITQKWVHFSVLCTREQWSDIRRTGFPSGLYYPQGSGTIPRVPDRWKYPFGEITYNSYNYEAVKSKDKYDTPLIWMKPDWHNNEHSGRPYN